MDALVLTDHIVTERLRLRPLRMLDAPFVTTLLTNAKVRQYLGGKVPLLHCPKVIKGYLQDGPNHAVWAVSTQALNQDIGLVFLSEHHDAAVLELSYQFFPTSWGKGFATEAVVAVRDYAFETLKQTELVAETQTANTASCQLLVRIGMTKDREVVRFGATQAIYTTSAPNAPKT